MEIVLPGSELRIVPRKIICVGQNYARHAAEMNSTVPEEPILFLKPPTALIGPGETVLLPPQSREVHHEVELVAVIGREGKHIPESEALDYVAGYALGLDMTARDLQLKPKRPGIRGRWPRGSTHSRRWGHRAGDGRARPATGAAPAPGQRHGAPEWQYGRYGVFRGPADRLLLGDLHAAARRSALTGTPEGVGPVQDGDVLVAESDVLPAFQVNVRRA